MKISKNIFIMLFIVSIFIAGCSNSNNTKVNTNSDNETTSERKNSNVEISDLQNLYFDIVKESDQNEDISIKDVDKIVNSYDVSNISDSNNEKNISMNDEKIKIEYTKDKNIEKVTYFNNSNYYSKKKDFFKLEYQNTNTSEDKFSIIFRGNDLNRVKEILTKLDSDITKFSLYNNFLNIAEDMNSNDNLKESDLENSNYKLEKFDYDGFYKKGEDCYITVSTLSDKNKILSLKMFYPNGEVAIQFGYKSKSSLVLIYLDDLDMQKIYVKKLNTFFN